MMNERIKQLIKQHGVDITIDGMGYGEGNIEGLAELIVKECMRQVEEQYKPVIEDEAMMKDEHWKGYKHCGVDSIVAIRKHFGVEE